MKLEPIQWNQAVQFTNVPLPHTDEVVAKGFSNAQAFLVLLMPEDVVYLHKDYQREGDPDYEKHPALQPRPNVLFEAGIAFGIDARRTIFVEIGELRPYTDIQGYNTIKWKDTSSKRQELAERLEAAGCPVDLSGTDWHDFPDLSLIQPQVQEHRSLVKFESIFKEALSILEFVENDPKSKFLIIAAAPVFGIELPEEDRKQWTNQLRSRIVNNYDTKMVCLDPRPRDGQKSALDRFCSALARHYKKKESGEEYQRYKEIALDDLLEFGQLTLSHSDGSAEIRIGDDSPYQLVLAENGKSIKRGLLYFSSQKTLDGAIEMTGITMQDLEFTQALSQLFEFIWNLGTLSTYKKFDNRSREQVSRDDELRMLLKSRTEVRPATIKNISLMVHPGVIPPDFEIGIEQIIEAIGYVRKIDLAKVKSNRLIGIDVGTGTGILALKLAEYCSYVYATDIDDKAVNNAIANVEQYLKNQADQKIEVYQCDLLEKVPPLGPDKVPLIVFNHPFYPSPRDLYHTAVPDAGIELIKRFLAFASKVVGEDGKIIMPYSTIAEEHNPSLVAQDYELECKTIPFKTVSRGNYVFVLSKQEPIAGRLNQKRPRNGRVVRSRN
jgi:methylase of polypeptide subunit release factors